ncbi:MAG: oligoribonuclease [Propionibacteriaceae bacterium]|nr:oligoribonuclease [Propionibacteriaceae bacterium]
MNDYLVWIDCEMTGLDFEKDALIEIAVLVTDSELKILGDGVDLIIKPPNDALAQMVDIVTEMHTASGLLDELKNGITIEEAEAQVLEYIKQYVPEPRQVPLAGNSIGTDRTFLARDMPALESHLHYRNVDVSSIKELARRWYPSTYYHSPKKLGNHRALGDIKDSIIELRYYRYALFVPQPGLSSESLKEIASLAGES